MAASELELALERSTKLPITDVSLLQRRKMIERGYDEAMELLNKCNQQAAGGVCTAGTPAGCSRGKEKAMGYLC